MARKAMTEKWKKEPKYRTGAYIRCRSYGRSHPVLKESGIYRICFRELAYRGEIPGYRKVSW